MPKFFTESLEIENRKRLALLSNLAENMNHLLGDGAVVLVSPCLDFAIEPIWDVLDIQGSHVSSIMPPLCEESADTVKPTFQARGRDTSAMFSAIDRKVHGRLRSGPRLTAATPRIGYLTTEARSARRKEFLIKKSSELCELGVSAVSRT
jgi:hypothetical protein